MATIARNAKFDYVDTETLQILAVDDDPIQREFCSVYMTSPTVSVETADCAEAGLERLETKNYGALLVDVDMPGMSGIELVTLLRSRPEYDSLPIMVITGNEDIPSIDAAYAAGATAFMCKPVNWRLLSHQVRFMVRAHRALMAVGDNERAEAADNGVDARQ